MPNDLKIVYYGPIGKIPTKTKEKCKIRTQKKLENVDKEVENFQPKAIEVDSIIQTMSSKSRYYDMNSTKESEKEMKKLHVTYYPMVENKKQIEP